MSATELYHTWQQLLLTLATNGTLLYIDTSTTWKMRRGKGSKMQLPTHCVELGKNQFHLKNTSRIEQKLLLYGYTWVKKKYKLKRKKKAVITKCLQSSFIML